MKNRSLFILAVAICVALGAVSASAQQVVVGLNQRFFEKFGDGSTGPDSVPCCNTTVGIGHANPAATVMTNGAGPVRRTGGEFNTAGAYFAEYKNKTAMVGNRFGFGTPAVLNGNGKPWYGLYNKGTGGVVIRRGRYTSMATLMLKFASGLGNGGNLRRLTTNLVRTVLDLNMKPNGGVGNFTYDAATVANLHIPPRPTFRNESTYLGPYAIAGHLYNIAGAQKFGGTRSIIHTQFSRGVNVNTNTAVGDKFDFPVANGLGRVFTPLNVVRRETRSAMYAKVQIADKFATTGPLSGSTMNGTGWFTILPYTTGVVKAQARTIGTVKMDFTNRTDRGINTLMQTTMGGITGKLQLVSGHLLQSRGGNNTNLAGTNMTIIRFTPEPASAAMLGVGALGLIGMIVRDRRRNTI